MEVILREDVAKLGGRGQVVRVADGYARNFLLPKRIAVPASEANKKIIEQERQAHLRKEATLAAEAQELAKLMTGVSVTIEQKAGEQDQLFGSVTARNIADALARQDFVVDHRKIHLQEPIRMLGEYSVPLRLHRDVSVDIAVKVLREGGELPAPDAEESAGAAETSKPPAAG